MSKVKAIPDGYEGVIAYLRIKGAAKAVEFYKKAFGATEIMRIQDPSGRIGHSEIKIGDAIVMLADEFPEMKIVGPETLGGSSVTLHLYVEDVDKVFRGAIDAGAKELKPVQDQFYGDRSGRFVDPFGHEWILSTHIEDVSPAEMEKRAAALFGGKN